jgi:hypothetical protein
MLRDAFISIGAGYEQVTLIRAAKRMGLAVIGVDRNPDAFGFADCDATIIRSTYEAAPIMEEVRKLETAFRYRGVATKTAGISSMVTAEIAETLGLPGVPPKLARIFADKSAFSAWAKEAGLPIIPTEVLKEDEQPSFGFPVIVKPSLGLGGKEGVRRVDGAQDFGGVAQQSIRFARDKKLTVQPYIEGVDVVVCNYLHKGSIVNAFLIDETNVIVDGTVVTKGFATPSALPDTMSREAMELNAAFVKASGLRDGLVWLSMRIPDSGAPYLMEVHIDFAGDWLIDRLFPAANKNYDFIGEAICVYVGESPHSIAVSDFSSAAIYFLYARDAASEDLLRMYDAEMYPHVMHEKKWGKKQGDIILTGDSESIGASVAELNTLLKRPPEFTNDPL